MLRKLKIGDRLRSHHNSSVLLHYLVKYKYSKFMPTTVTGNGRSHVLALINAAVVDQTRRQTTNLSFNMPNSARGHLGQVLV